MLMQRDNLAIAHNLLIPQHFVPLCLDLQKNSKASKSQKSAKQSKMRNVKGVTALLMAVVFVARVRSTFAIRVPGAPRPAPPPPNYKLTPVSQLSQQIAQCEPSTKVCTPSTTINSPGKFWREDATITGPGSNGDHCAVVYDVQDIQRNQKSWNYPSEYPKASLTERKTDKKGRQWGCVAQYCVTHRKVCWGRGEGKGTVEGKIIVEGDENGSEETCKVEEFDKGQTITHVVDKHELSDMFGDITYPKPGDKRKKCTETGAKIFQITPAPIFEITPARSDFKSTANSGSSYTADSRDDRPGFVKDSWNML